MSDRNPHPRASRRSLAPSSLTHSLLHSSAHLHICSSSHLLSHLLIFTSAHVHIFSHICSSSHLLMSTSSLISHLLIFTSAHVHIFSHICSSSHLLIFTPSLTSSHLHIFSPFSLLFSPFSLSRLFYLSPSLSPFLSLAFFIFLSLGGNETPRNATLSHEMRFDRQKLRKNCDFQGVRATLSHEMRFDRQKLR